MKPARYCFFVCLPLFTGCASVYMPSPASIPLFEEKGETQIEAGVSTNSIFVVGNYAFSEKYALIANGNLSFYNFSSDLTIYPFYDVAHRSIETGLGRYNMIQNFKLPLEIFTGIRYGNADRFTEARLEDKMWYLQSFIQVNFGKRSKYNEIGSSSRVAFSYISFAEMERKSSDIFYTDFSSLHLEQLCFFRFGGEHLKVTIRVGMSIMYPLFSYTSNKFDSELIIHLHHSVGLSYHF